MRIIKKYNNRKLYDMEESQYVSLADIYNTVREGHPVKIVNAQNQDITAETLLTVVLDRGKESDTKRLTTETLVNIINFGDGTLAGFVNKLKERN